MPSRGGACSGLRGLGMRCWDRVTAARGSLLGGVDRGHHAVAPDEDDVGDDEDADDQRQESHVPEQHLARVEDVEAGADADRVEAVLGLPADPLGVEVGLGQVAGEGGADGGQEGDARR